MKNKSPILTLFFLIEMCSCSETKIVSYKITEESGREFHYYIKIPKGYTVKKMFTEHKRAAEYENVKRFKYPDSSMIFFSDNLRPSAFYPDAYRKYGKHIHLIFLSADTITINGLDEAGKYWEDRKIKHIVYGYRNVPLSKKGQFDKILDNIEQYAKNK